MTQSLSDYLRGFDTWAPAVEQLTIAYAEHGADAVKQAEGYANRYTSRRAAMVFDVVYSRQRKYESRVLGAVEAFEKEDDASQSLSTLARSGPRHVGLRSGEAKTMSDVAAGLLRFGETNGIDNDDEACARWADASGVVGVAHGLDPYVGAVRGIGPALFNYARMRSGGDAIKPDVRVRRALTKLGFLVPQGDVPLLLVAEAAASELGVTRLVLDQLLWWSRAEA